MDPDESHGLLLPPGTAVLLEDTIDAGPDHDHLRIPSTPRKIRSDCAELMSRHWVRWIIIIAIVLAAAVIFSANNINTRHENNNYFHSPPPIGPLPATSIHTDSARIQHKITQLEMEASQLRKELRDTHAELRQVKKDRRARTTDEEMEIPAAAAAHTPPPRAPAPAPPPSPAPAPAPAPARSVHAARLATLFELLDAGIGVSIGVIGGSPSAPQIPTGWYWNVSVFADSYPSNEEMLRARRPPNELH